MTGSNRRAKYRVARSLANRRVRRREDGIAAEAPAAARLSAIPLGRNLAAMFRRWWPLVLAPFGLSACAVPAMRIYPCDSEGAGRSCTNTCGDGIQLCQNGSWGACVVPPTRIACSDNCGQGTRLCQNNQLSDRCEVAPVVEDCSSICGPGTRTCANNQWGVCTAPQPKQPKLTAVVRDFHMTFPDVMSRNDTTRATGWDSNIVADVLGDDDKPVYAHTGPTLTVAGPDTFHQWYRDVAGTNVKTTIDLPLSPTNASKDVYGYSNTSFFPIDGQLFGNEGEDHNYGFTVEIVTTFRYQGGETFTFWGDDDVFVFINRILAIDLGGIHEAMGRTVDLDMAARELGITTGGVYPMHIFFAERHPIASDFVLETSLSEFAVCD
jgi:fibro-slime domain-containing protein